MNMQDAPVDTPRLRILDHVRRKSAISRIDPLEQIGISPTTVSVLCAELIVLISVRNVQLRFKSGFCFMYFYQ